MNTNNNKRTWLRTQKSSRKYAATRIRKNAREVSEGSTERETQNHYSNDEFSDNIHFRMNLGFSFLLQLRLQSQNYQNYNQSHK